MSAEANLAFGPGADLWILPERKNSGLVQKLDWYLNFQIAKSSHHEATALSTRLKQILEDCELENQSTASGDNDSLLILTSHQFPNRWILVLRGSDSLVDWVEKAMQKWEKMNSPSLRIFLPQGASPSEFRKLWKKSGGSEDINLISDRNEELNG